MKTNLNDRDNRSPERRELLSCRRLGPWPPGRGLSRAYSGLLLLCGLAASLPVEAQTNTNSAKAPTLANRYLIVVEISKTMKSRGDGTLRALQDLFDNSLRKQLHAGDSIGVWTYNSDLHAGNFPLQQWSPDEHQKITERVIGFLQTQKNEKAPHFEKVLPSLKRVVGLSRFITVILVTSGDEEMHGTPLDDALNRHYQSWRKQQQEARMPVISVLCAENRQFTQYSVTPAPWKVELPPLAKELVAAREKAAARKAVAAQSAPAPRAVAPLIVIGKRPRPAAPASTNAPAATELALGTNVPAALEALRPSNTGSNAPPLVASAPPPASPLKNSLAAETPLAASQPAAAIVESKTAPADASALSAPSASTETAAGLSTAPQSAPARVEVSVPASPAASPATTVQRAAEPASEPVAVTGVFSYKLAGLAGLLILAVMGGLWLVLRSPVRPEQQISLITRSFEQTKH